MAAFVVLTGLMALAVFVTVAFVGILLRLAIRLVLLPLFLIKWIVMGVLTLIVGPVVFLAGAIAFIAVAFVLAVPLLPVIAVAALVWLIVRANRRPAVA